MAELGKHRISLGQWTTVEKITEEKGEERYVFQQNTDPLGANSLVLSKRQVQAIYQGERDLLYAGTLVRLAPNSTIRNKRRFWCDRDHILPSGKPFRLFILLNGMCHGRLVLTEELTIGIQYLLDELWYVITMNDGNNVRLVLPRGEMRNFLRYKAVETVSSS